MSGALGVWLPVVALAVLTLALGGVGAVALVRYGFGQYWVFVGGRWCTVYKAAFGWCWIGPDGLGQMQCESRAAAADAARRHTRRYLAHGVRPLDRVRLSGIGVVYTSPGGDQGARDGSTWYCAECEHLLIQHPVAGGCRSLAARPTNPHLCSCTVDLDATPEAARRVPTTVATSGAVR